jgi:hypothetical protein
MGVGGGGGQEWHLGPVLGRFKLHWQPTHCLAFARWSIRA